MESYSEYKANLLKRLVSASGKTWEKVGIWTPTGKEVDHILPLRGTKNTPAARAEAIKKLLNFDSKPYLLDNLKGLHRYAHHLNSSQLLCMMFFSQLTQIVDGKLKATEKMMIFIKEALGINIHVGANCKFEYTEDDADNYPKYQFIVNGRKGYEGTSFDFHIEDGQTQIYFEIKLTEYGFGKVLKPDPRHQEKAEQYVTLLPDFYKSKNVTSEMMLENYQIIRNIIRANNINSYVVFITDGDNPKTNCERDWFIEQFGQLPRNVQFTTWQNIALKYPCKLPFQLEAMVEKETRML